jgi:enoyl-CoA hydratase
MDELVLVESPLRGVAVVTLNRPEKYNALSSALLAELATAMASLAEGDDRVVILTGAGPAFCAGIDLGELGAGGHFGADALDAVRSMTIPLICAVNGVAITGGLELALACDFRIASERARFADTHSRVGVVPAWGLTARLPQAVGQAWARQMSFTGDFVDAATAQRIGLVNEVVAHGALLERALALATAIVETAPKTATRIRAIYDLARDETGSAALAAELQTSATTLALEDPESFAARREAVFDRGRCQ